VPHIGAVFHEEIGIAGDVRVEAFARSDCPLVFAPEEVWVLPR
jgi:hypothetical protein